MRLAFILAFMQTSANAICAMPKTCFVVEVKVQGCEAVTVASPLVTNFLEKQGERFKKFVDPDSFQGIIVGVSELRKTAVPCLSAEEPGSEQFAPYEVAVSSRPSSFQAKATTCKDFHRGKILRGTHSYECCDTGPTTLGCAFDLPYLVGMTELPNKSFWKFRKTK